MGKNEPVKMGKKAQKRFAQKKEKRKRVLILVVCVLAFAGIVTALVLYHYNADTAATVHSHFEGCC